MTLLSVYSTAIDFISTTSAAVAAIYTIKTYVVSCKIQKETINISSKIKENYKSSFLENFLHFKLRLSEYSKKATEGICNTNCLKHYKKDISCLIESTEKMLVSGITEKLKDNIDALKVFLFDQKTAVEEYFEEPSNNPNSFFSENNLFVQFNKLYCKIINSL